MRLVVLVLEVSEKELGTFLTVFCFLSLLVAVYQSVRLVYRAEKLEEGVRREGRAGQPQQGRLRKRRPRAA